MVGCHYTGLQNNSVQVLSMKDLGFLDHCSGIWFMTLKIPIKNRSPEVCTPNTSEKSSIFTLVRLRGTGMLSTSRKCVLLLSSLVSNAGEHVLHRGSAHCPADASGHRHLHGRVSWHPSWHRNTYFYYKITLISSEVKVVGNKHSQAEKHGVIEDLRHSI